MPANEIAISGFFFYLKYVEGEKMNEVNSFLGVLTSYKSQIDLTNNAFGYC